MNRIVVLAAALIAFVSLSIVAVAATTLNTYKVKYRVQQGDTWSSVKTTFVQAADESSAKQKVTEENPSAQILSIVKVEK